MSAVPLKKQWSALLSATLENWAHQLLYVRHVYPRETFGSARFLGVRCRVCRHPAVVSYISDTVNVVVPSIVEGVANEISFVITETDENLGSTREVEKYKLRILDMLSDWKEDGDISQLMKYMERSMRDVILQVHSLHSERATSSDSVSFKITMHIPEENTTCSDLNQAFAQGTWVTVDRSDPSSINEARQERIVPLHQVSTPVCRMDFSLERTRDKRKPPPS